MENISELYLPPLDSRTTSFDVDREVRRTLVDLIREKQPTTIMGVLLAYRDGVTIEEIADKLDEPVGLIHWNVGKLEDEYLCIRVAIEGTRKVVPIASYIESNEQPSHYTERLASE
jgi:DNA-binding transcriptional regulator GbsR (MarR family)